MNERGWSSSDFDLKCLLFADWLAAKQEGGLMPHAVGFRDTNPSLGDDTIRDIVTYHASRGHVHQSTGLGGVENLSVRLSDEGLAALRQRKQRQGDEKLRALACRDALLDWLYACEGGPNPSSVDDIRGDPRSFFEGSPFTDEELHRSALYLKERGLLDGLAVWQRADPLRPQLTSDGRDCIEQYEGSVAAFMRRSLDQRGDQIITHFNAPVHGQVGIAGGDLNQTQHQGIDGATLQRLLDDVREAAEQIDPAEKPYLLVYVDTLQAEADAQQPNAGIIRGTVDRLGEIAGRVGNATLSTTVAALTTILLKAFGIG